MADRNYTDTEAALEAMYRELDEASSDDKKRDAKKMWKTVGNVLFALVLAAMLFCLIWIQLAKEKGETPMVLGVGLCYVETGSMEPTLPVGSVILTKEVKDKSSLNIKDIVTFYDEEGRRITHRIVDKLEMGGVTVYVTKGDNNNSADDGYLTGDRIISVMVLKLF